jgi:hypothetical protein
MTDAATSVLDSGGGSALKQDPAATHRLGQVRARKQIRRMQSALEHLEGRFGESEPGGFPSRVRAYLTPRVAGIAHRASATEPDTDLWEDCGKLYDDMADCLAAVIALESGFAEAVADVNVWLDALSTAIGVEPVSLVIPAPREWLDTDASIVRLRFAGDGPLGLPVAAHEYGHFVATQMKKRVMMADDVPDVVQVFEQDLRADAREKERPAVFWKGHELFADAFATWVTGPAYVWYCRVYRFDPVVTDSLDHRHPPDYLRLRTMETVLQAMAAEDPTGSLAAAARALAPWIGAAVAAQVPPEDAWLTDLGETMARLVTTNADLRPVAYSGADHVRARSLATGSTAPVLGTEPTAIVLNALWELERALLTPASAGRPAVAG